jgi:hypothetical protein
LSGGLLNVTRQQAGETLLSKICFAFVVGVVFSVAFIGSSCGNQMENASVTSPRRSRHCTLVSISQRSADSPALANANGL